MTFAAFLSVVFAGGLVSLSLPSAEAQAPAKATVTVKVHGIASGTGAIRGLLCPDPAFFGQNGCDAVRASAPAKSGSVDLVFTDVPHGVYGLSLYHDEDGSGGFSIVSEPMAFGNGARDLPPVFDNAALKVTGDLKTETELFRMVQ
jgi:uncharacterized protein (DUF2141 family)